MLFEIAEHFYVTGAAPITLPLCLRPLSLRRQPKNALQNRCLGPQYLTLPVIAALIGH
jgi:hypothetical protein